MQCRQLLMACCLAAQFHVGIVPQNQVPQSTGVTWPGCIPPVRSLPWESCPVFVWPSQSFELTFEPVPAALPHRALRPEPPFSSCGHSRCLQSLHQPHPRNCWGHHISCKALLFSSNMLPAQVLLQLISLAQGVGLSSPSG